MFLLLMLVSIWLGMKLLLLVLVLIWLVMKLLLLFALNSEISSIVLRNQAS